MSDVERYRAITLRAIEMDLARDVRRSLTAPTKSLPCKYFYDRQGMALFEQICELPEYYLTRVETTLLKKHGARIVELSGSGLTLVELGSGSSAKTRYLIEPCLVRQPELLYHAVDISAAALHSAARRLLCEYPPLHVVGLVGEFADGLGYLAAERGGPRLVAFLGSTVGNFTEDEIARFLNMLRGALRHSDRFLLGVDLVKDSAVLEAAYDDARSVTAEFNLNLLARINRELDGQFDLAKFRHQAIFNAERSRVEMHLVSLCDQCVRIEGLDLDITFKRGELVHTENCYKYSQAGMTGLLEAHGFELLASFTDPGDQFCLFLAS